MNGSGISRKRAARGQGDVPLLELREVCVASGGCTIERLSLSVSRGETFGILGPASSGKTALFDVLSFRSMPQAGSVRVMGKDLWRHARLLSRYLGSVPFPSRDLNILGDDYTARENLDFHAGLLGFSPLKYQERIDATLSRVGLKRYDNIRVGAFTGGMKRRLAFARALLIDPLLVIIDQPTAGVAEEDRPDIWELLRSLKNEGKTLVLTTSTWEEAQVVCDRVARLAGGELQLVVAP
jgi:ABC-2 type transport system ATP-binding protein